jgi:hypothetical protein
MDENRLDHQLGSLCSSIIIIISPFRPTSGLSMESPIEAPVGLRKLGGFGRHFS